jgi:hypothetical protein
MKAEAMHPRFLRDVRGGHAIGGATLDHAQNRVDFGSGQLCVEKRIEQIERQMQRMEDQIGGFVVGVR